MSPAVLHRRLQLMQKPKACTNPKCGGTDKRSPIRTLVKQAEHHYLSCHSGRVWKVL